MALIVPPPQVANIKTLLELTDEELQAFLEALGKVGPQFNLADFSKEVSTHVDLPKELIARVVAVLGSLYLTRDTQQVPLKAFVDQVGVALEKADTFSEEDADIQWARLQRFFVAALSLERTLGTAAKAGHVLTQHEHILQSVRIMTDLRPIFHSDVSESPDSVLIVHMLRVTERDAYHHFHDRFYALDSNDLLRMKAVIDRALRKEKALKAVMQKSGVTVLDPRATY